MSLIQCFVLCCCFLFVYLFVSQEFISSISMCKIGFEIEYKKYTSNSCFIARYFFQGGGLVPHVVYSCKDFSISV